uniref:Uncharacterized protein n=1 Tax=Cacopsylla melanoneura TaxID=428564 RepID=A0A8D8TB92_9HEMI
MSTPSPMFATETALSFYRDSLRFDLSIRLVDRIGTTMRCWLKMSGIVRSIESWIRVDCRRVNQGHIKMSINQGRIKMGTMKSSISIRDRRCLLKKVSVANGQGLEKYTPRSSQDEYKPRSTISREIGDHCSASVVNKRYAKGCG